MLSTTFATVLLSGCFLIFVFWFCCFTHLKDRNFQRANKVLNESIKETADNLNKIGLVRIINENDETLDMPKHKHHRSKTKNKTNKNAIGPDNEASRNQYEPLDQDNNKGSKINHAFSMNDEEEIEMTTTTTNARASDDGVPLNSTEDQNNGNYCSLRFDKSSSNEYNTTNELAKHLWRPSSASEKNAAQEIVKLDASMAFDKKVNYVKLDNNCLIITETMNSNQSNNNGESLAELKTIDLSNEPRLTREEIEKEYANYTRKMDLLTLLTQTPNSSDINSSYHASPKISVKQQTTSKKKTTAKHKSTHKSTHKSSPSSSKKTSKKSTKKSSTESTKKKFKQRSPSISFYVSKSNSYLSSSTLAKKPSTSKSTTVKSNKPRSSQPFTSSPNYSQRYVVNQEKLFAELRSTANGQLVNIDGCESNNNIIRKIEWQV